MTNFPYSIDIPTEAEAEAIDDALTAYNAEQAPFTQAEPYIAVNRCARDSDGNLLGGILAYAVCWHILYIDTMWVRDGLRGSGIGGALLRAVEDAARALGCKIAHLSTFDFQAPSFYASHGYSEFGILPDSPAGHTEHFFCKRL